MYFFLHDLARSVICMLFSHLSELFIKCLWFLKSGSWEIWLFDTIQYHTILRTCKNVQIKLTYQDSLYQVIGYSEDSFSQICQQCLVTYITLSHTCFSPSNLEASQIYLHGHSILWIKLYGMTHSWIFFFKRTFSSYKKKMSRMLKKVIGLQRLQFS